MKPNRVVPGKRADCPSAALRVKSPAPTHKGEEKRANLKIGHYAERRGRERKQKQIPNPPKDSGFGMTGVRQRARGCGNFGGSVGAKAPKIKMPPCPSASSG